MYSALDFFCIFCGGYLMYVGIVMKTRGKLISNVVLSKGISENAIRDKEGFIKYLYGKLVLIGAVIVLAGIVKLVIDYLGGGSGAVSLMIYAIYAAAVVAYGMVVSKALKKYTG